VTTRTATAALLAVAALGTAACGGTTDDPIEQSVREQAKLAAQTATTPTVTTPAVAGPTIQKLKISKNLKKKPTIAQPSGSPPTKLYTRDIVVGKGKKAGKHDKVSMQYVGTSYSTGSQVDASWDRRKQPYAFTLGQGAVIEGWDRGVPGMRVGGRRLLVIPADLAYGAQGRGSIAPNETLIFVVDLKKVG
jgi:peptidylprolyl isomerase